MTYADLLAGARIGRWPDQQPPNQIDFDGFHYAARASVLRFSQITVPKGSVAVQFSLTLAELMQLSASDFESKINGLRI